MGAVVGFIGGTVVGGITSVALTMLANPQSKTAQSAIPLGVNAAYFLAIQNGAIGSLEGSTKTGVLWAYGLWGVLSGIGMIGALTSAPKTLAP